MSTRHIISEVPAKQLVRGPDPRNLAGSGLFRALFEMTEEDREPDPVRRICAGQPLRDPDASRCPASSLGARAGRVPVLEARIGRCTVHTRVRSEVLIAPKFEARCAALTRSGSLTGSMWPSSRGPLLSFYVVRRGIPFRSRCPTRLALLRITQIQNVCRLTF